MSLPLLRNFFRALVPTTPEIQSTPFKLPFPSLLVSRSTYFTPNPNTPLKPLPFLTSLSHPFYRRRHFHTSPSPLYARPPMLPRSSALEPQQQKSIEEMIDGDARMVWANGRWVFKKRVLERNATALASKVRSSTPTIETSKHTPPAPPTKRARFDPYFEDTITAARRRRRARSRSRRKTIPSTTTRSSTPNMSTPFPKGAISGLTNLTEIVPKGSNPSRPASISAAGQKTTAHRAATLRAATVTIAKQSSPTATQTVVHSKSAALPPVPPTSHVSSFFDSNRSHLARAELAPARPPVPSGSLAPELLPHPVSPPITARIKLGRCGSWTSDILHSQLAHLRTTWAHQRRLRLHLHLLHPPPSPLSDRAASLPPPPPYPPTLSSLACLSPQAKVQLPSSPTSFYSLSWDAYQKLYNTGVSGKTLSKAERLFRACGRKHVLVG